EDFFFFPNMITRSQHVNTGREKLASTFEIHADAAGRILGICDDQIDFLSVHHSWNKLPQRAARGTTDDIAKNQNTHDPNSIWLSVFSLESALRPTQNSAVQHSNNHLA